MSASGTTELGNHVAGSVALQCQLDGGAQDDCAKDSSGATGCEMRSVDDQRVHLELPAVQKEIRRVHEGRRSPLIVLNNSQTRLFTDSSEV